MAKKVNKATFSYGGDKLSLTKSKTKAAVQYTGVRNSKKTKRGEVAPPLLKGFELVTAKRGIDQKLDALRQQLDVAVGTHVWNMEGDEDVSFIPTGNLYIEFIADSDVLKQQELLEKMGLSIKEVVSPGAYRASVTPLSPNPIKCAMELQKDKMVLVAEPEFATTPATRDFSAPSGRFIGTQWHHENTGQAIPVVDVPNTVFAASHFKRGADAKVKDAWAFLGSLGNSNLKIAVIDTGFATDHPQLRGDGFKIRNPFNAANRTTDVSPFVRFGDGSFGVVSHGTSCAAVAAGSWDVQGILGAAPNSRLILIKLDVLSDDAIKNAFEYAMLNGADVISCSLGYPKPVPLSTFVTNYIRKVAQEGRGGRGIPMFFAAGNANPASNNMPRQISDFAAHPDGICVTASNSLDLHSGYSFFGSNAFLCAPTNGDAGVGITTATCDLGSDGRSVVLGYTSGFGGTSSATPLAAGICALMLTANPDLRVSDVRNILRLTVDKIGPAGTYDSQGHSDFYGFGRINALRAVQMAASMRLTAGTGTNGSPTGSTGTSTTTGGGSSIPVSDVMRGRVTSPTLNVRSGPSTSNPKVATLRQGDVISLLERIGGWWRIASGQFVSGDFVAVLAPTTSKRQGKVISATLNVRTGPAINSPKVATLRLGNLVTIFEKSADGWLRIGDRQWVSAQFVREV